MNCWHSCTRPACRSLQVPSRTRTASSRGSWIRRGTRSSSGSRWPGTTRTRAPERHCRPILRFAVCVLRVVFQRKEENMHLAPSITIVLALAGTAQAATPDTQATAPTRESVEAAVLECHEQYAHRYGLYGDAAPSEIAAGSFAACRQQMAA